MMESVDLSTLRQRIAEASPARGPGRIVKLDRAYAQQILEALEAYAALKRDAPKRRDPPTVFTQFVQAKLADIAGGLGIPYEDIFDFGPGYADHPSHARPELLRAVAAGLREDLKRATFEGTEPAHWVAMAPGRLERAADLIDAQDARISVADRREREDVALTASAVELARQWQTYAEAMERDANAAMAEEIQRLRREKPTAEADRDRAIEARKVAETDRDAAVQQATVYEHGIAVMAAVRDRLLGVAKAYEDWEGDVILNADWGGPVGEYEVPRLSRAQWDHLVEIQALRNVAVDEERRQRLRYRAERDRPAAECSGIPEDPADMPAAALAQAASAACAASRAEAAKPDPAATSVAAAQNQGPEG